MKNFLSCVALTMLMSTTSNAQVWNMGNQNCMVIAVLQEARGESDAGQRAVFDVIMNRVASPRWPDTICGVVYQKAQFSWSSVASLEELHLGHTQFQPIKRKVLRWLDEPVRLDANHFHATSVSPSWANTMKVVARIGGHIFYKG